METIKKLIRRIEHWLLSQKKSSVIKRFGWLLAAFAMSTIVAWTLAPSDKTPLDLLPFQALLIGLPVALILWIFRTTDAVGNMHGAKFSYGENLLKDINNIGQIRVGIGMLIDLSEQAPIFNDDIKAAFLSLLSHEKKEYPPDKQVYAQDVLVWLDKKGFINGVNPINLHLNGQEFDLDNPEVVDAFKKFHKEVYSFYGQDPHVACYYLAGLTHQHIYLKSWDTVQCINYAPPNLPNVSLDSESPEFKDYLKDCFELLAKLEIRLEKGLKE